MATDESVQHIAEILAKLLLYNTPVDDVTDLAEAQRMLGALREYITKMSNDANSNDGWYISLDDEHERMLDILYKQGKLNTYHGDETHGFPELAYEYYGEIDEALSQFVEDALDLQWDTVKDDDVPPGTKRAKTA